MSSRARIMWIEQKTGTGTSGLSGLGRIGRVAFSPSGKSVHYRGRTFRRVIGFKHNHQEVETRELYWISGCRKDGSDALYSPSVEIADDVQAEYWTTIRQRPDMVGTTLLRVPGKYSK